MAPCGWPRVSDSDMSQLDTAIPTFYRRWDALERSRPDGGLVLDFNYAYAPSCAHHPRWVCPLAPPENALDVEVDSGELDAGTGNRGDVAGRG